MVGKTFPKVSKNPNKDSLSLELEKNDWERTFDSVPDLIAILDNQYRIVSANRAMTQQLGVTLEKIIGQLCYRCIHGLDEPPDFCPHTQTIKDGNEHVAEVHEPRIGGDFIVSVTPIKDEKGQNIGSVHIARNVTNRKKTEEALRHSEELYRTIFDNSDDGFILVEPLYDENTEACDFRLLKANLAYERQTGRKIATIEGKRAKEIAPNLELEWIKISGEVAKTGKPARRESYNERTERYYEAQYFPFAKGQIGILFRDVTERKKIEQVLKENQKKYQDLTETTNDFIWEMDTSGRYTYCSPQMEQMWGLKPAEMIGKTPFDLMPPDEKEKAIEFFKETQSIPKPFSGLQTTAYDSKCRLIYLETNGVPFFDDHGKLLGFRGMTRDVTERKKADGKIRKSEERLRVLTDSLPEIIFETDIAGRIIYANKRGFEITGYTEKDLAKKIPVFSLIAPQDKKKALKHFIKTLNNQLSPDNEFVAVRKDGTTFPSIIVTSVIVENERPIGLRGVIIDITERKKAEQSVLESEAKYRELVNLLPEMVFEIDANRNVVFANARALELTGYSMEDFKKGFEANNLVAPEDKERSKENMKQMFAGNIRQSNEYMFMRKDGTHFPVSLSSAPIIRDGKTIGARGVAIDITQRKKLEKQLHTQERLAAIGATAGMVGHDIRNPLQAIAGDVYLLKKDFESLTDIETKNDVKTSLNGIEKNVEYINKIVGDLQDFARPSTPTLKKPT